MEITVKYDRREDEKAIDYVRRKVDEARKLCTTEKQLRGIDIIMEALSLDDAIFNDLTISNAHKILQLTGANLQEAVHLYKELTDPKERREYKKRKAQRRLQRLKGFFDPILKRFDPLIKKIKETITGEGKGS